MGVRTAAQRGDGPVDDIVEDVIAPVQLERVQIGQQRIEPAFDVGDDIAVRAQADTGKTDEVGKNVDAALTKLVRNGTHVSTTWTCCGKSHKRSQPSPRTWIVSLSSMPQSSIHMPRIT